MSVLEEYEKRMNLEPLSTDDVLRVILDSEAFLTGAERSKEARPIDEDHRVIIWLHEKLQEWIAASEGIPAHHVCAWCWRAEGANLEAWRELPRMNIDDIGVHAQQCEHNPLVQNVARLRRDRESAERQIEVLTAELEDLRGRTLSGGSVVANESSEMYEHMRKLHESTKATIRALLAAEMPAGELRRALGELAR